MAGVLLRWWQWVQATPRWWQRLLLVALSGLCAWLFGFVLLRAVALVGEGAATLSSRVHRYGQLVMARLSTAMPFVILLIILTYLMGKPGKALRRGLGELVYSLLMGCFAIVGVNASVEKEKKRRKDEDDEE